MTPTLDAFRKYMECQLACKSKKAKGNDIKPFVTISRQTGAGGITIGRKLVTYLNQSDSKATCPWMIMDKTLVQQVLEEHDLPETISKYMDEKKTSEISDIVETMFKLHPPMFSLVKKTSETILHLANMGYAVIVGRGANVVTHKLEGGFHVRLIGSLEKRIKHAQEFYSLDPIEAGKLIQTEDKGRAEYLKQNFGKNIDDPMLYDEVINTDHISYDDAAKQIADEVLRRQMERVK